MRFSLVICALGFTASAGLMVGCSSSGGSSLGTPSNVTPSGFHSLRTVSINGLLITAARPDLRIRNHAGPAAPDKHHEKIGLYQYVSNFYSSDLLQFDYPKGDSPIREIYADNPQGECGDVLYGSAKRDFWVVNSGSDDIDEFSVGSSVPIKTLIVPTGEGAGCAMDPSSHNLGATILGSGDVVIFTDAPGRRSRVATRFNRCRPVQDRGRLRGTTEIRLDKRLPN